MDPFVVLAAAAVVTKTLRLGTGVCLVVQRAPVQKAKLVASFRTDIAFAPSDEMFMSNGYGNARVHKFSADGNHLFSWSEPGNAPGQFNLPHGVWIDRRGRLLVADRENDRVHIFDQNGKLLTIWSTELIGPAFLYVDKDDIVYIPEHPNGARIGGSRNNFMRTLLRSRLLSSAPTQSTSCARPV